MNAIDIIKQLGPRQGGGIAHVKVNRPGKLRAAFKGENIRKVSTFAVQKADYAARGPVREAVAAGEREAPQLPKHIERAEKIDGVRFWIGHNGKQYLPVPLMGDKGGARSHWEKDGKPVELSEIAHMLLASETAERPSKEATEAKGQAQFVGITLENIESIS